MRIVPVGLSMVVAATLLPSMFAAPPKKQPTKVKTTKQLTEDFAELQERMQKLEEKFDILLQSLEANESLKEAQKPNPPAVGSPITAPNPDARPTNIKRPLPPGIEEAMRHQSVKAEAGDDFKQIIDRFGPPSADVYSESATPRILHTVKYNNLGLNFNFRSDTLYGFEVKKPYEGEVLGVRIGDSIDDVKAMLGEKCSTFETSVEGVGRVLAFHWQEFLPTWFFYVKDGRVVSISMYDKQKHGNWTLSPN